MAKKNKKGFTLIELLAVIVIIVIIAVVAVPIVLNIVKEAREKSFISTARGVVEAAEWYYAKENLEIGYDNEKVSLLTTVEEKKVSKLGKESKGKVVKTATKKKEKTEKIELPDTTGKLNIKGKTPEGIVYITSSGNIALSLWSEDIKRCAIKNYESEKIEFYEDKLSKEECIEGLVVDEDAEAGMMWDGWITLELYYPEDSTEQKWTIIRPNEVREEEWNDYEGAITIPIEDIENVYICYKVAGKTVIIPPKGTIAVKIEPEKYEAKAGEKVNAIINATEGSNIEYKIWNEWVEYEEPIWIEAPGLIEARASMNENVYDSEGNVAYTRKITAYDSVYIREEGTKKGEGTKNSGKGGSQSGNQGGSSPGILNRSPNTGTIIPSYGTPNWGNGGISSKTSNNTTVRYKTNNTTCTLPEITVTGNPGFGYKYAEKMEISATSTGDSIKYSTDGVMYDNYSKEIEVTSNKRIYFESENDCGITTMPVDITNIGTTPPVRKRTLSVSIEATPNPKTTTELSESVEIKIDYDKAATNKYYKIGENGEVKEYEGPFIMTENDIVYAYATSTTGYGEDKLQVNNLKNGISAPIIIGNPPNSVQADKVNINITYDKNATSTKYKIGNGGLYTYGGSFNLEENTTIYAENMDSNGNKKSSTYTVSNIKENPPVYVVNKGDYFIIRLNYPSSSKKDSREYKYGSNDWTKYKEDGILLITKNTVVKNDGTIEIEDENGKKTIFSGDYYYIEGSPSEIMSNIKMRWDTGKPETPQIVLNTEEPATEVEVSIVYDKTSKVKECKIINPDGTNSGWQTYSKPFKILDKNTIIYARAQNAAEVYSETGTKKITNIDEEAPVIKLVANFTETVQKLKVRVSVTDDVKVDTVMYASGVRGKNYFKSNGTSVENNSIVTITENGDYTFYAKDGVGNEQVYTVKVENIDNTAPFIEITDNSTKLGISTTVSIDYGDSSTKKYKIGNGSWTNYIGDITITSDTVISNNLGNTDGTVTICAQGVDSVGNTKEVCDKLLTLDIDKPTTPVITSNAGYPVLSEYGIAINGDVTITYDTRTDIDNYYSTDGTTWTKYTGKYQQTSGTIYAKSVKKATGLTVQASKTIGIPGDALGTAAYDSAGASTWEHISNGSRKIAVDSSMWGKKVKVTLYAYSSGVSGSAQTKNHQWVKIQKTTGTVDYAYLWNSTTWNNQEITIPENTTYLIFESGYDASYYLQVKHVYVDTAPIMSIPAAYPTITEYGVKGPTNVKVTISYHDTTVTPLYKINDGDWQVYNDGVTASVGDTIYAKSVNKYNGDSLVAQKQITSPGDALGANAYDSAGASTYVHINNGQKKIAVDPSMWGKKVKVALYAYSSGVSGSAQTKNHQWVKIQKTTGTDTYSYMVNSTTWTNQEITIPENTTYLIFESGYDTNYYLQVKHIYIDTTPILNVPAAYPTITSSGITGAGSVTAKISYHYTANRKLYRINDGNWQTYDDGANVSIGSTIYAKSVNKYNEDSLIAQKQITSPGDALGANAYDSAGASTNVKITSGQKKIAVDSSMWGKKIKVTLYAYSSGVSGSAQTKNHQWVKIQKTTGTDTYSYMVNSTTWTNKEITIPENTTYLIFESGSDGAYYLQVKHISVVN